MKTRLLLFFGVLIGALICGSLLIGRGEKQTARTDQVGMILHNNAAELGFSQALREAAEAVCAERGLTFVCYENVEPGEPFSQIAERLIGEGYGLILCDDNSFDDDLLRLAGKYPSVSFLNGMGTVMTHNLASCMRRAYQMRYLCGLVAGMQTRTGEIGYVVSSLTAESIRQLNAFVIGVRKVNPSARVYVRDTNGRDNGEKAAVVTANLLDSHKIDVLTHHTGSNAPLRVADERGIWTIGYNNDASSLFSDTWLVGYSYNWKAFYAQRVDEWTAHRFVGQRYLGGVRDSLLELTPLSDLTRPDAQEIVNAEYERLVEGTFDVFFGPVTDIYGTVQIREDENISDERLINGIHWFADGVVLE